VKDPWRFWRASSDLSEVGLVLAAKKTKREDAGNFKNRELRQPGKMCSAVVRGPGSTQKKLIAPRARAEKGNSQRDSRSPDISRSLALRSALVWLHLHYIWPRRKLHTPV
jgi:hypothetical protein